MDRKPANTQRVEGHTRLPWSFAQQTGIISSDIAAQTEQGIYIPARTYGDNHKQMIANAALICHAVNNIERLEKVNEALVLAINTHLYFLAGRPNFDCFNGADREAYEALLSISRLAKEPG